jgi:S-DNA-T family DNA segregation ATPase FtsK/SpoIIIE
VRLVFVPVVLWLVFAVIGGAVKASKRPIAKRGATVVGTAATFGFIGLLWRKRGLVVDGAAVTILAVGAVTVAGLWWFFPDSRRVILAATVAGAAVGLVAWDHRVTGGRKWGDVLGELKSADRVRAAIVATNPDAKPGAVTVRAGRVEANVEHVGPVDVERIGQVLHAPHVELVPGSELGRSMVSVHDAAPALEVDPWTALAVAHRWPGPWSQVPDADIPVGVDVHGRPVILPFPGAGGKHLLIGGSTGAGKSVFLSVLLAELAFRPHMRFMFGDPKYVELALWEPRAAVLAGGEVETGKLLDAVYAEMMGRYRWLGEQRRRKFIVGEDGDQIMLVVDELSAVTTGLGSAPRVEMLNKILAMGRAAAVGLIGCTQQPSYKIIPTSLRANFRSRVGLGCDEEEQTEAIMNSRKWPCHDIPPSLPGVAYVRIDRTATLCRSYLLEDDDIDRVAAATAHLKGTP